jgi:hypothetical protein
VYIIETTGFHNDLWYFNVGTGIWNWVAGSNAIDVQTLAYTTQGTYSPTTYPTSRDRLGMVIDSSNRLFMTLVSNHCDIHCTILL